MPEAQERVRVGPLPPENLTSYSNDEKKSVSLPIHPLGPGEKVAKVAL